MRFENLSPHSDNENLSEKRVLELEALMIKRDVIKAELDIARKYLSHFVQMVQERMKVIEAEARLARLKGQSPPEPPEDFEQQIPAARKEVEELESQLADIERQISL